MRLLACLCIALYFPLFAQLDTAALTDNTWVNLWNPADPLTVSTNNWAYENDFQSHPFYGFFIMGPGHCSHPQDCYWYPFDPVKKKWTKIDSPRRPPRQCLSAFAVGSQDTIIYQMGGFEASHQQSQGKWDAAYSNIDVGGGRGSKMWVYSFNRNEWYPMRGPQELPPTNATQIPQYDPVHDIVISSQGTTTWLYSFHNNRSRSLASPSNFYQYYYSTSVDTRRGVYYVLSLGALFRFNPDTEQWATVPGPHPPCPSASSGSNGIGLNMMAYDEVNDVLVYIGDDNEYGLPSLKTWVFDCDSLKWTRVTPAAAPQDRGRLAYNRALNAFVLLGGTASSAISRGGGTQGVWAYRYKRGPGPFGNLASSPDAILDASNSSPMIRWKPVKESGVTGYNVYRGSGDLFPKNFQKLNPSPVADTFHTDASAPAGTFFAYKVCAVKGGAEGRMSRILYARPAIVRNVVASVEDTHRVRVSWDANPQMGVTGYNVYRARGTGIYASFPGVYQKLNSAPVAALEFTDTVTPSLSDRIARGYVVTAVNGLGLESGVSTECTTFPESPEWAWVLPNSTPQGLKMAFRWQPPRRSSILGVNLYRVHSSDQGDSGKTGVMTGGGNFFFPTRTYATRQNTTLITDSVSLWSMPPNITTPPGSEISGYYLQGKTYIARAVNLLGQEGFGTDQVSPNNAEYGYGIVIPTLRFNYNEWRTGVAIERAPGETHESESAIELWPNPFNPVVNVAFRSRNAGMVRVRLLDASGRCVRSADRVAQSGRNLVSFESSGLASGLYLAQVRADGRILTVKAVLMK